MEVKDVRCCDTAALVALINMLKVNLGSTPEVYNTLLAVLCDYDPSTLGNRERVGTDYEIENVLYLRGSLIKRHDLDQFSQISFFSSFICSNT